MPAVGDTPWHSFSGTEGEISQKSPVPNELLTELWRITGLDRSWLTMHEMAKIKPQVDGLAKFENGRYGWGFSIEPRKPG